MNADGEEDLESFVQKQVNLYRQQELIDKIVGAAYGGSPFVMSEDLLKKLHAVTMFRLLPDAGLYRTNGVGIRNSNHLPPPSIEVNAHMVSFCEFINRHWGALDLCVLGAFTSWRLNWIHPFSNGNGRTSRGATYLVMCMKHGKSLPPKNTILQQLPQHKSVHDALLTKADEIYLASQNPLLAIKPISDFLSQLLTQQLKTYFEK